VERALNIFRWIDGAFEKAVEVLLIGLLVAMMLLVGGQVILRNVFSSGISWADVASRHMVLWITFLGAMLATRSRQHIAIDVLIRFFPKRLRNSVRIGLDILAATVAFLLTQAAYAFVLSERAAGTTIGEGFPTWIAQLVIPFGFGVIAFEYAVGVALDIWRLAQKGSEGHVAGRGRR
jgi:TRAP-type C4-dicarboxylate transport system permease small subunit